MNIDKKLTPALDAIGALKNLQLEQLIPLLQAIHEKVKSSTDLAEQEFFECGLDDILTDAIYFQNQRYNSDIIAAQEAEAARDRKHGFDAYNGFSIPSFGY